MGADQDSLLEAMEQQSISIAKAGVVCTLSARTAVIAAANPKGGHYDRKKTTLENLAMKGPLFSRFDLVYILEDKADELRDEFLAKHVLDIHGQ